MTEKIQSPCRRECALDDTSEFCTACFRTSEEIFGWRDLSADDRARIMAELPDRARRLASGV